MVESSSAKNKGVYHRGAVFLAAFAMMVSACHSDGIDLGRDGKPVSSFSDDDRAAACEDVEKYYRSEITEAEQIRANCTLTGTSVAISSEPTTNAELQMACATARDDCVATAEGLEQEVPPFFCSFFDDCEATIGEIELCYEEQIEANKQYMTTLDCANLTLDEVEEDGTLESLGVPTPESCKALQQKCPRG